MAVLIASNLRKELSGDPLFDGVSFKVERRDRLALSGPNGAGKTTLLRALSGEASLQGGELAWEKGARVALHDQRPPATSAEPLRNYVLAGTADLAAVEEELRTLEQAMASGTHDAATMRRYADAQARLEHAGGYDWRDRAASVVRGLGFTDADLDRPLHTFSGGELTRASLARALASQPDLLLLDEPTNHLDIESLEWLERTLVGLDAAIIMVAHDRWFLEAVGTSVLEVEAGRARVLNRPVGGGRRGQGGRARFFNGTWARWRREQAAREMALGKAIEKQQAEIARMEAFVERFRYKATKARQAQSRLKKLDKIERIERDPRDGRELGFQFKKPERSGRVIFEVEDALLQVGADPPRVLLAGAELWLERGEHVSLVGPNGTGKTTLIEALAGRRDLDGGRLRSGHNVKVGYLSQHGEELEFGGARTVLQAAQRHTGLSPNQARALLGRFLFSGEEAEKPLDGLSGGERKRLGLAILVASGSNVLILDEPTNHLDLESREALEDALRSFAGALILVTHDRALLDAVGSRTVAVEDYTLRSYLGGWPEYARIREERKAAGLPAAAAPKPAAAAKPHPKAKAAAAAVAGPSKNRQKEQARLEKAVETAEADLARLEDELADPSRWTSKYESAKSQARHTAAKRAVEEAYAALQGFEERSGAVSPASG